MGDNVHGYEIKRSILFENDRGLHLGKLHYISGGIHSVVYIIRLMH